MDPELDLIRIYRRQGERFSRRVELSAEAGDVLTSQFLPELAIPLQRIFEESRAVR